MDWLFFFVVCSVAVLTFRRAEAVTPDPSETTPVTLHPGSTDDDLPVHLPQDQKRPHWDQLTGF